MPLKRYRTPQTVFKFPFRVGGRSMAQGGLNAPKKAGGTTPTIKQFTEMQPGRPKKRMK